MHEIVKTNVKRQQSSKRHQRRTRYHALYFALVMLLVLGVGVSLSMTLLFNITTIEVANETDYADADIIALSGIEAGDNLVRLDTAVAAETIRASLPYAESVKVKRQFPSTVVITVTEAVPVANVQYSHDYLLISGSNRILATVEAPMEGLMIVEGFQPATDEPGQEFASRIPGQDDALRALTAAVIDSGVSGVRTINIEKQYNVIVYFGEHITFEMGGYTDAVYKLRLAAATIDQLTEGRAYRLRMVGDNQISVVNEDSVNVVTTTPPDDVTESTETTTAAE